MKAQSKKAVFTSCNLDYLDRAILLAETCKKHTSDFDFILILSDFVDFDDFAELHGSLFDRVIDSCELGIPRFLQWSFRHSVVELCTAVKAHAFIHLLDCGYEDVIYLDPDIACFSSLDSTFNTLDRYSILLTPHQLNPAQTPQQFFDNELCSFQHGIYNLGFLAIRKSAESERLLSWWSTRLYHHCKEAIEIGIFTDQKWFDAAPAFFNDLLVLKHPGLNVASWNLSERHLEISDTGLIVNGSYPLVFYHFTKYFGAGREMTMRYAQTTSVVTIWNWYGRKILEVRERTARFRKKGKYQYFKTGDAIAAHHRLAWKEIESKIDNCSIDPYECPQAIIGGLSH